MKRPSFQFYPADWLGNAKLSSCSSSAKGAWIDIMCTLHDMDEYGVCRWPLKRLAKTANVSMTSIKQLVEVGVLKGADEDAADYTFTPMHAGKAGETVIILSNNDGPIWYCSRMVLDEYKRMKRGGKTRFSEDNQPAKKEASPKVSPNPPNGDGKGDGATSTSTSTSTSKNKNTPFTNLGNFSKETVDNAKNICGQLRIFELKNLDPTNARLLKLIDEGASIDDFLEAVIDVPNKKPLNYLLSKMERNWWKRTNESILATCKRLNVPTQGVTKTNLIRACEDIMSRVHTFGEGKNND